MTEILQNSAFLGVFISIGSYAIGVWLRKKTGSSLANPLLVSIILVVLFLLLTGMSYDSYRQSTGIISDLLTPSTICLAVPLYQQLEQLKHNYKAVISGIVACSLASMVCVLLMAIALGFTHQEYVTFLPKSITTAIGYGVSEELGGIVPITVICIIITGVIGNVLAEQFLKLIRVHEPIARGIAIGTSSHAIGTVKAMEMGEIEGAMSGLSIVVAGFITVLGVSVFALFW